MICLIPAHDFISWSPVSDNPINTMQRQASRRYTEPKAVCYRGKTTEKLRAYLRCNQTKFMDNEIYDMKLSISSQNAVIGLFLYTESMCISSTEMQYPFILCSCNPKTKFLKQDFGWKWLELPMNSSFIIWPFLPHKSLQCSCDIRIYALHRFSG